MRPRPLLALALPLALAAAVCASAASASAPATLAYQGRLADAGGNPISASLSITFRLYADPSGGTPLWSETQNAVDVDGGNLAVELGQVVALPRDLWGRQLYLGIQIAGDGEMAPRPRLTAAPFALRAGSLMRRTIVVSAEGTPQENGSRLLATVAAISDASATAPVAIELDAGRYDLGSAALVLPSHTRLSGKGQAATFITSAFTAPEFAASLQLGSDTEITDLTAENTAVPLNFADSQVGIAAIDRAAPQQLVARVRLQRVTGISRAAPGTLGQRAGISVCAFDSQVRDVVGRALGGQYAMGLRADCPGFNLRIEGALIQAADATEGIRGSYFIAGQGNVWRDLHVQLQAGASVLNVYGLRFLGAPAVFSDGPQGRLSNVRVSIQGSASGTTSTTRAEGIVVENAGQLAVIEHSAIDMRDLRATQVSALRLRDGTSNQPAQAALEVHDLRIRLRGRQDSSQGGGETSGIRIEAIPPRLSQVHVQVECLAGDTAPCIGIGQSANWSAPAGSAPLRIEHSLVEAGHVNAGAGASAAALELRGRARVEASSLRLQRSSANETVRAVSLIAAAANLKLQQSSLVATDAADSNSVCLLAGPAGASAEWYGNHLQGQRCDGGQVNLICAGNTLRGTGLLAGSCP
ncbi:hypothetical protein [uncultured Aquimonas sp.]|uniref:hypothetical protein n=1 Tax=uncultured Aquimonas sp. TaxID=385483 RepID=UPI00086B8891|nr:hypothetical protein [uncultured Aquimonas sp.]ODU48121.1 MAG: hypothetical protein ABS96_01970 [Xanthomonadaceae bacterium SCN 69-123]